MTRLNWSSFENAKCSRHVLHRDRQTSGSERNAANRAFAALHLAKSSVA